MKSKRATKLKRPGQFAGAPGSANTPLKADVENGILTVKIGVETLEWASRPENGGPLEGCKVDGRCRRMWAKDVVRAMEHENEIGESPLGKFLDSMMEAAANNGSAALCWPNDQAHLRQPDHDSRKETK